MTPAVKGFAPIRLDFAQKFCRRPRAPLNDVQE
jgi:hypothetical protein